MKAILDLAKDQRQQPYFTPRQVPAKVIQQVDEHNGTFASRKWSYHLLPVNKDQREVPHCQYTYVPGDGTLGTQTPILSSKDQCRMWCYASYAIEFALIADKGQYVRTAAEASSQLAT